MDFNTRYYLIESVQQVLNAFGTNCVLTGLNIKNITIDDTHILNIEITNGKVIADSTVIEYPTDFAIGINTFDLDDSGSIILSINFRYIRTSRLNQSTISLKYLDSLNQCEEWFIERDRIVLAVINFDKTNHTCDYTTSTILDSKTVMINNIEYDIRPYNYTIRELQPILKTLNNNI